MINKPGIAAACFILALGIMTAPALPAGETISTVAGGGPDGIPALQANLDAPVAVAFSPEGELYIAAGFAHRVFRVDAGGIIHVAAGAGGNRTFAGDGGPAVEAKLYAPNGITFDPAGNLVIADTFNARIRRVDRTTGIITTIAGTGQGGNGGDGGAATAATFLAPTGVAYDADGNLYIVDQYNNRVRKVDAATGNINAFAGNGQSGFDGDTGPAALARLNGPTHVVVDAEGVVYITDSLNRRVRRVGLDGNIDTEVEIPGAFGWGLTGLALDGSNLYMTDADSGKVFRRDLDLGTLDTVVSSGLSLQAFGLGGLAVNGSGTVFVADSDHNRVVAASASLPVVAGNGLFGSSGDGLPANQASLSYPASVALSGAGDLIIAEARIRRVDASSGIISTVAGNGEFGDGGDGGPALNAEISAGSVALDAGESIYFADCIHSRVRKIDALSGIISTVAGNGDCDFAGDGGPATEAAFCCPASVAFDLAGNLLIADDENHRIRRVNAITGVVNTIVGTGVEGFGGDDGPAAEAQLNFPIDLGVDLAGNLFLVDAGNGRIRKVDAATGNISTVAGNGLPGTGADGQPALLSPINPEGIGLDAVGNIFFAERGKVRRIDSLTNLLSTVAGTGESGFSGDGGPAILAKFDNPADVTVGEDTTLFVSDIWNFRIRAIAEQVGTPPVADAGADIEAGCESGTGAEVTLDGSGSTDPDSTEGTNDDIVLFEWFEDFAGEDEILLGTGETLIVTLPPGEHHITLRVTDSTGRQDADEVEVTVGDLAPPTLEVSVRPSQLWPPNLRLVPVHAMVLASDDCGEVTVELVSITSSEPDPAPEGASQSGDDIQGAEFGTADFNFFLRAEREGSGPGRTYTISYRATDAAGNTTLAGAEVLVPHDRRKGKKGGGSAENGGGNGRGNGKGKGNGKRN